MGGQAGGRAGGWAGRQAGREGGREGEIGREFAVSHPIMCCRAYFVVGILWILLSLVVRIMTARVVRLFEPQTVVRWSSHIM